MGRLGEFLGALPDVAKAIWTFGGGWYGVAITGGSVVLIAGFLLGAKILRAGHGWLSAIFGMMGTTIALWWGFGILPSAWVYFMDGQQELLEGRFIPSALPLMGNFPTVFRDVVVVAETGVAAVVGIGAVLWVQKHYPRSLTEGEDARPQSGGYK